MTPGFWRFFFLVLLVGALALTRDLSGGTPFFLVGGVYFPWWLVAATAGAGFALLTVSALRARPETRAFGSSLVFFSLSFVYAYFLWLTFYHV